MTQEQKAMALAKSMKSVQPNINSKEFKTKILELRLQVIKIKNRKRNIS